MPAATPVRGRIVAMHLTMPSSQDVGDSSDSATPPPAAHAARRSRRAISSGVVPGHRCCGELRSPSSSFAPKQHFGGGASFFG